MTIAGWIPLEQRMGKGPPLKSLVEVYLLRGRSLLRKIFFGSLWDTLNYPVFRNGLCLKITFLDRKRIFFFFFAQLQLFGALTMLLNFTSSLIVSLPLWVQRVEDIKKKWINKTFRKLTSLNKETGKLSALGLCGLETEWLGNKSTTNSEINWTIL